MEGRRINIYLTTPLFRFKYVSGGTEQQLLENTMRLHGVVLREAPGGVHLKVEELSNLKVVETDLPFEEVFVPYAKIDHIVFVEG